MTKCFPLLLGPGATSVVMRFRLVFLMIMELKNSIYVTVAGVLISLHCSLLKLLDKAATTQSLVIKALAASLGGRQVSGPAEEST